jgi:hypothetical protein
LELDDVLLDIPDNVCVTVTVFVTPVGKVVGETVLVP